MGAACCCFPVDDIEDHGTLNRQICFNFFTAEILHVCCTLFRRRGDPNTPPSSEIETTALQLTDNSACDTYRSPPRPLPYEDPRCSALQGRSLSLAHGKPSIRSQDEPGVVRKNAGAYSISTGERWNTSEQDDGLKSILLSTESSLKKPSVELVDGVPYVFTSSEDEDSCPICLEEYTLENPCITMQCNHDFHLACIYEWMERSDACPICGKVMVFEENT